jgi:hypothetical protein
MAIADQFESFASHPTGPAIGGADVVPDDGTDLPTLPRALMVSGSGDVAVVFRDGSQMTLPGLVPGVIYPVRVMRVLATGTSATGIKGLF